MFANLFSLPCWVLVKVHIKLLAAFSRWDDGVRMGLHLRYTCMHA